MFVVFWEAFHSSGYGKHASSLVPRRSRKALELGGPPPVRAWQGGLFSSGSLLVESVSVREASGRGGAVSKVAAVVVVEVLR